MELSRKQETGVALGLTALCVVAYYIFGSLSPGFYQHDEVAHYLNMKEFWYDWHNIVTLWAKPGFKIFYVLPALLGEWAVTLLTTLLAASSGFIAYLIAREYKLKFALAAVILCGFQPFFYQTAFRNYSEFLTAVVIGLGALMYVKDKYLWAAFFFSYSFALRQETALITLIIGLTFLLKRQWIPFLVLGWTPIALNIVGWIAHGDPLWVLNSASAASERYDYAQVGFWHYWKWFTPTMGTIPTFFFLLGYFGFAANPSQAKEHFKKYMVIYLVFTVYFITYCLFVSEWFTLVNVYGILRTLLAVSPLIAVFGVMGLERVWGEKRLPVVIVFGALALFASLVMAFLSHKHTLIPSFTEEVDPSKFMVLMGLGLILAATTFFKLPARYAVMLVAGLTIAHTVSTEKPQPLSLEDQTCQQVVDYYLGENLETRPTLMNHSLFYYFSGLPRRYNEQYRFIDVKNLDTAEPGTILLYDTHYGGNQEQRGVITYEFMTKRKDLRIIKQFVSPDKRFAVLVMEKLPT
jgi:hypothetical protein